MDGIANFYCTGAEFDGLAHNVSTALMARLVICAEYSLLSFLG